MKIEIVEIPSFINESNKCMSFLWRIKYIWVNSVNWKRKHTATVFKVELQAKCLAGFEPAKNRVAAGPDKPLRHRHMSTTDPTRTGIPRLRTGDHYQLDYGRIYGGNRT